MGIGINPLHSRDRGLHSRDRGLHLATENTVEKPTPFHPDRPISDPSGDGKTRGTGWSFRKDMVWKRCMANCHLFSLGGGRGVRFCHERKRKMQVDLCPCWPKLVFQVGFVAGSCKERQRHWQFLGSTASNTNPTRLLTVSYRTHGSTYISSK